MAGISSKAFGGVENRYKYNGIELDTSLGLDEYEAQLRDLDPQTGRWWQVDSETEDQEMWSPYTSNYDNPILYKDPRGNEGEACCGGILDALADAGNKIMLSASGVVFGAANTLSMGMISSDPFNIRPNLSGEEKMYFDNARTVGKIAPLFAPGGGHPSEVPEGAPTSNVKSEPGSSSPEAPISNTKQRTSNKQPGSYTNTHVSEKTYSGKGPEARAKTSANRVAKDNNDPHKSTDWTPSKNTREAFKDEDKRIEKNGGAGSSKNYNKINSPGKKYNEQDNKKE